jgi:hypothetical protein
MDEEDWKIGVMSLTLALRARLTTFDASSQYLMGPSFQLFLAESEVSQ